MDWLPLALPLGLLIIFSCVANILNCYLNHRQEFKQFFTNPVVIGIGAILLAILWEVFS